MSDIDEGVRVDTCSEQRYYYFTRVASKMLMRLARRVAPVIAKRSGLNSRAAWAIVRAGGE